MYANNAGIFPFNTSAITLSGNMTSRLDTIGIDYDIWLQRYDVLCLTGNLL